MKIIMIMMLLYFLICALSFSIITWVMIKSIKGSDYPPNNDDDGGMPGGNDFPLIDLPPGGTIEDILVDRWYEDISRPAQKS